MCCVKNNALSIRYIQSHSELDSESPSVATYSKRGSSACSMLNAK